MLISYFIEVGFQERGMKLYTQSMCGSLSEQGLWFSGSCQGFAGKITFSFRAHKISLFHARELISQSCSVCHHFISFMGDSFTLVCLCFLNCLSAFFPLWALLVTCFCMPFCSFFSCWLALMCIFRMVSSWKGIGVLFQLSLHLPGL